LSSLYTREPEDNAPLAARLRDVGARVIEVPCLRIEPLADVTALETALAALTRDDWLVVTSRHGADAVSRCATSRASIAAVGKRTADRLRAHGIAVDYEPDIQTGDPTGERLGRELPRCEGRVVLARSDRALPDVPAILRERGFVVEELVAYRTTVGARGDIADAREALAAGGDVAIFFESPSAIDGLLSVIEAELVLRARVFVKGRSTLRAVREWVGMGADIRVTLEAANVAHR
jgi:uroporphyrinogen-III synthase